jgi:hypothetical protein
VKITTEDFAPLATLVKGYELQPGKHYLFVAGGKKFDYQLAHALVKGFQDFHPDIHAAIIGEPGQLDVRETTLADELEALKADVLDATEIPNVAAVNLATFVPLLDRAIKVLRGEQE